MAKRTTIYIAGPLEQAIGASPSSLSGRLATIGDRYNEITRRVRVEAKFSEPELNALRDCCNGTLFEPAQLIDGAILANFEDSAEDGLYGKWEIDGQVTAAKLAALTYPEQVALVEAIEQWWRTQCPAGPSDPEDEGV
jgi:hypothetical protein